ncbi:hypothetical protein CHS0354_036185 [Potamilus streckersoni]|uniref:CUB domain-containing protein n=1 Tax=Potamilus streckersoni TaxID=2493646 RepID=A0AAE0SVC3_9BIVA|nr:hypothetical protein CHS0354_036185 [Potamilus streckersoni]
MEAKSFVFTVWITLFFSQIVCNVKCITTYYMADHCGDEISMILEDVYLGRLLVAHPFSDNNLDCVVIIESWSFNPYITFHFEEVVFESLDCTDSYVTFQDGKNEVSTSVAGLQITMCGRNKTTSGIYSTTNRYLRIHYRGNPNRSKFSIIFNCYDVGSCDSFEYKCDNGWCINNDLNCNGYNPCGDNSDCQMKLSTGAVIGIVIGCIVLVGLTISMVICIYCCMHRKQGFQGTVTRFPNQPITQYLPADQYPMTSIVTYPTNIPT